MDEKLKILFINCLSPSDLSYSMPLSVAYLAGYLKGKVRPGVLVKSVSTLDKKKLMQIVRDYRPDIAALTLTSTGLDYAKSVSSLIKKFDKGIKVIVGGPQITLFPKIARQMDFGIAGEGERTFFELLTALRPSLSAEKPLPLGKINGLLFWKKGKMQANPQREFIKSLDEIGHPVRGLLNSTNNNIFSSRGCPYNCVFCSSVVIWKRIFRMHSARYVFDEIKALYGLKHSVQWFSDDLFTCNKQRIRELIGLMRKEGLLNKVSFLVSGRSNLIDDEMARLLKELNVVSVSFGFETGDEAILRYAKKLGITVDDHIRASTLCRKHGILVGGYLMIGFPDDTHETVMRTYDFAKKYTDACADPNLVMVFPRTELDDLLKKGTGKDYSRLHLRQLREYGFVPVTKKNIICKNLTAQQIIDYKKKFASLGRKKMRLYYIRLGLKLLFSRSIMLNTYYLYKILMTSIRNPRREYISREIAL